MLLHELLPPARFLSHALVWLVVVVGWVAATVWVDRDARQGYGDGRPWNGILVALGIGLAYFAFSTGMLLVGAIGWIVALVVAVYVAMKFAVSDNGVLDGYLAPVRQLLRDLATSLRMAPATAAPVATTGTVARSLSFSTATFTRLTTNSQLTPLLKRRPIA
jgi:hypothetical protein